jgi:outer membrane PBP1 activator LpoA protein
MRYMLAVVLAGSLAGCSGFPSSDSTTNIECQARRDAQAQKIAEGKASASTAVRCGDDNDAAPQVPA